MIPQTLQLQLHKYANVRNMLKMCTNTVMLCNKLARSTELNVRH